MPTVTEQPYPHQKLHRLAEQNIDQSVVHVVQDGGVNLSVLDPMDMFCIKRRGTVAAFALDKQNHQLFSYSESIITNNAYAINVHMSFLDTEGREFIKVDIDMAGLKIANGPFQLGTIPRVTVLSVRGAFIKITATSTLGKGSIEFVPEGGAPSDNCFCVCCRCLLGLYCCCFLGLNKGKYDIFHNGELVGSVKSNKMEGTLVTFPAEMDSKVKALIVVGSFVLSNAYFQKNEQEAK